jgi:hypothetical protein
MLKQEIGSRVREGDLLSQYYEPKNVAKRPKTPKLLVSKSCALGVCDGFFFGQTLVQTPNQKPEG